MLTLNCFFEITLVLRAEINPGKAALVIFFLCIYFFLILLIFFIFFVCANFLVLLLLSLLFWKTNLGLSDWSSSPLCA